MPKLNVGVENQNPIELYYFPRPQRGDDEWTHVY
jgi:hypothetical protein